MRDFHILLKPASGMCNLRCNYCFYKDETQNREIENYGFMTDETLEQVIKKSLDYSEHSCTIAYQGGEPTLCGLGFYQKSIALQKKYNNKNLVIHNVIQTNGYNLSDELIHFFKENHFLVGISLDGVKETHDIFRVNPLGNGSYKDVMKTIQKMQQASVDLNILTVIHSQTARRIQSIYEFYKKSGFEHLQFIPCLNPLGEESTKFNFTLSAKQYERFLKDLFDLWYRDGKEGHFIHIQQFENYILMLMGLPSYSCGMNGVCSYQNVVEADGAVYPCDFYVLDQYKLGNLNEVSFAELNEKSKRLPFVEASMEQHSDCISCKYNYICHGGCRRYREPMINGNYQKNTYCEAYYAFFEYAIPRLKELAHLYRLTRSEIIPESFPPLP